MLKVFDFEKTPIVDIVNEILVDASSRGASDIHFDPKDNILQIRIRIDGELVDYATVPEEYIKNLITRIKIISGMNITESRLPQDGAIKGIVKDIELDLRVSSINTNKGEKIVIRILDYTLSLNGIEKLGFTDYNYKKVLEMISKPNGIILVTGATGTGKTTTVYSMLQRLSNVTTNIMSIEDPVEMDLDNVNQIQVNADIGLTFATALRSILRQDPNIIMIGEIRDSETATIAIRASVTGHLVLSTLHTNDSLSTIERLLDMNVEKYLLAEALEGIISQRLARRLCPHCKKLRKTTPYEKELIKKTLNLDVDEIYEAVGCEHCNHGYKGRIAFQEVLTIDQKIQDALSMNIRKDKLRNLVYNDSVITLLQDGMIKVLLGDTTIEELLRLVEFDDESIITFNLPKDILDNELNKLIEYQDDVNEDNNIDNEVIEDEIIVPETSDVVIDSIDDTDDENIDVDNTDIDNMDSLDNDEEFIDKIDEVITEQEDEKESKRKKKKKKKEKETDDNIEISPIEVNNIDNSIPESESTIENLESLDSDNKVTNKKDEPIVEDNNNDSTINDDKTKKKKKAKKKKTKKNDEDIIIEDKILENTNNELDESDLDNNEELITNIDKDTKNKDNIETKADNNDKSKKKKKKTKTKTKTKKNEDIKDSTELEISQVKDDNQEEIITNDNIINIDEVKQNVDIQNQKNNDIIIDDDSTFITKVENYVKDKRNKNSKDIDIIDEIDNLDNKNTVDDSKKDINQDEITDKDIIELEEAIESIETNDSNNKLEDIANSNDDDIENTIKISVKNDVSNDINVSEVKTINMAPKDNDTMESLDYNTNFIDKIYDSINTNEKRMIEKNNIDYEKIERLEDIQGEIGSRVSRMLNKKRYRKKKSE